MPLPLEALLWHETYSVVRGLMNEMDHWIKNKNQYLKKMQHQEN